MTPDQLTGLHAISPMDLASRSTFEMAGSISTGRVSCSYRQVLRTQRW